MNNNQLVVGVTSFCAILITVVAAASGLTTLSAESSTSGGIDGSTNGGLSGGSLTNSFLSMLTTTPSSENSTGTTSGNLTSSFLSMLTTTPSSENSTGTTSGNLTSSFLSMLTTTPSSDSTSPYTTTTVSTSPACTCDNTQKKEPEMGGLLLVMLIGFVMVLYALMQIFLRLFPESRDTSPAVETIELLSVGGDGQNVAEDGGEGPSGAMNTQPTSDPKEGTGEEKGPDNSNHPTAEHKKSTRKTRHLD